MANDATAAEYDLLMHNMTLPACYTFPFARLCFRPREDQDIVTAVGMFSLLLKRLLLFLVFLLLLTIL